MPSPNRRASKKRTPRTVAVPAKGVADVGAAPATRTDRWSSTTMFVLAIAGAAIGFKTIWQFPYLVAQNGGGAFILVYLLLALVFGVPVLMAQIMLGRRVHASPVKALAELGARVPGRRYWAVVGAIAVVGGFVIFSYLSVIAGWTVAYFVRALFGALSGLTADGMASVFVAFVKDPEKQVFWHTLFTLSVVAISSRGLRFGLEPAVRGAVWIVYFMLFALTVYSVRNSSFEDVARYLFQPDFTRLSPHTWLLALAQVFFSLGLGTAVALMYGAYLKADATIARAAVTVVGLDVLTSVIAAILVFGILFGGGVAPASGPNLMFQALPLAFDHLPFGRWAVTGFFAMLVLIALVAGIALLEPMVVWLEETLGMNRQRAAVASGLTAWMLGLVTVFSFNYAAFSFEFLGVAKSLGVFDMLQMATAELLLPLAAFLTALFAGWILRTESAREELALRSPCSFDTWIWLLRLLAPPLLVLLLVTVYRL